MKNLKEFFVAAVLFGLTAVGCGNNGVNMADLKLAAPENVEIQSLLARAAQAGTCSEQNLLGAQSASINPMVNTDTGANITFWISEMKTETDYDVDPPAGNIIYAFVYNDEINGPMIGILKVGFQWDGGKWNQVDYQIECKVDVNGTIQGRVTNAVSGAPLQEAVIYAESECGFRSPVSYVNINGDFSVFGMVPGQVTLRIYAPGFEDVTIPGLEVQTGQTLTLEYPVQMVPQVDHTYNTVTGRIFFRDGETPLSGVNLLGESHPTLVFLKNSNQTSGLPGTVDREGNFRIPFILPGEYQLRFASQALGIFVDENGNLMESITVTVDENDGPTVQVGDFRVDNMPPVIDSVTFESEVGLGATVKVAVQAADPDQDYLTYYWKTDGGMLSLSDESVIEWQAPDAAGVYTIQVVVNDGKGGADSGSIEITVADEPR
ncbi:MAG: carboxypeptidase regulatory-like domain-containing protein [bacterium]|nr:carboxypeptidase regulatory-like domain-containing protein [bacterium]